jgi:hypothetical protein
MRRAFFALAVLAGLAALPCQAAAIGFVNNSGTNSMDWITEVLGLGASVNANVTFDAHPVGPLTPDFYLLSDGVTLIASTGADSVRAGAGPADGNTDGAIPGEGPHASSNHLLMGSPGIASTNSLIVSFAAPVVGAGMFTIDRFYGGSPVNDIVIEAYDGVDATGLLIGTFAGLNQNFQINNLYFMGIVSTAGDIRSIRLLRGPDSTGDVMGVDDILFASADNEVPEPASLALCGAGLAAVALLRRSRNS